MQAGDLVFVKGHSPISYAIRMFDPGRFSHVAVAVSPTHIVEAEYSTKVRISEMSYDDFEVIEMNLTEEQRDKIVHEAIQSVGKWYDYLQIIGYIISPEGFLGSPNALICSELACELLKVVNIHIGTRFTKPNEFYQLALEYKKACA